MTNHRDLVWEKGMERPEIGQIVRNKYSGKLARIKKIRDDIYCAENGRYYADVEVDVNGEKYESQWRSNYFDLVDEPVPVKSILDLAKERNQSRSDGYGDRESFPAIRILWKAYLLARFGVDLDLTDADTADMLLLFKEGRKITRRNAGQYKKDDNVDQAGYCQWSAILEESDLAS